MRLYNKYNAFTEEGNELYFKAVEFCTQFAKECEAQGVDLRDAHGLLMNAASMGFAEVILRTALDMKKKEREASKA